MLRHRLGLALFSLLPIACFDPTEDAGSGGTDDNGSSGATEPSSATAEGGPSADPSSNPTNDPSAGPSDDSSSGGSGDPSGGPSSGDESSSDGSTASTTMTTTSDPSTTEGSSDDGEPSCAGQCAPEVPAGWNGPVVVYAGDDPPACPGDFPSVVHPAQHTGLVNGAATCDCECGDATGAVCGSATLREEGNNCLAAVVGAETHALAPNACTAIFIDAGEWSLTPGALDVSSASCAPQASESIATPTWSTDLRSCEAAAVAGCDDGACIPETPAEHSLCIWQDGAAACPAGPWTDMTTTYASFTDGRDCSACTCGTPSGSCGGYAELANGDCGEFWNGDLSAGYCGDFPNTSHATYVPDLEAGCAPSGGALQGSVTTSGAVTYCCM